jgi:hypothetical protein
MRTDGGFKARHVFAFSLALVGGGIIIWVIQLARQGDPVGYIILTGGGVLIALIVAGLVIGFVLRQASLADSRRSWRGQTGPLKEMYDSQRVLLQQNQALRRLAEGQLPAATQPGQPQNELQPGQLRTAEGYVIDGAAFDELDEE